MSVTTKTKHVININEGSVKFVTIKTKISTKAV